MTTASTLKFRLALAIGFLAMTASVASAASVARVDQSDNDSAECRFVFDEATQLPESPAAHFGSLIFAKTCPLADAAEVLNSDRQVLFLGGVNDTACYLMIGGSTVVRLLSRDAFQVPFGRTCADGLQCSSHPLRLYSVIFNVLSGVGVAFGIDGDVCCSEIDTEDSDGLDIRNIGKRDRQQKVEHAFDINQIRLPSLDSLLQPSLLVSGNNDGDYQSSVKRGKADVSESLESHYAFVVNNCRSWLEDVALCLIPLKTIDCFPDRANRELCRQTVLLADCVIRQFMDTWLAEHVAVKPCAGRIIGSRVKRCHRSQQGVFLVGISQQLNLDGELHRLIVDTNRHKIN